MFFGNKIVFWKKNFFFENFFFFWDFFFFEIFFFFVGTARHCPALPAAMFGRHCQPPFLVRHCYLRRFNIREGGRTVATGIVTQGQCVVELWRKKKQKWRRDLNPVPFHNGGVRPSRIGVYTEKVVTSSILIFTGNVTPCLYPRIWFYNRSPKFQAVLERTPGNISNKHFFRTYIYIPYLRPLYWVLGSPPTPPWRGVPHPPS